MAVMAWSRSVPQAEELRTPLLYCWKTDFSAQTVTEVGPLAMAALSWAADLGVTALTVLTMTPRVCSFYMQVPSLPVYA